MRAMSNLYVKSNNFELLDKINLMHYANLIQYTLQNQFNTLHKVNLTHCTKSI